jgi:hypothetical protein
MTNNAVPIIDGQRLEIQRLDTEYAMLELRLNNLNYSPISVRVQRAGEYAKITTRMAEIQSEVLNLVQRQVKLV